MFWSLIYMVPRPFVKIEEVRIGKAIAHRIIICGIVRLIRVVHFE